MYVKFKTYKPKKSAMIYNSISVSTVKYDTYKGVNNI